MTGPLAGIRIVEVVGLGPAPFCAMMLADHGAEVIRIDRPGADVDRTDALARSRHATVHLDLKDQQDICKLRSLVQSADGLIEGFRPGVMERLGLGPDVLLGDNPKLVYGRMTGWGQTGPLAQVAGHDINYIALSGALHGCGRAGDKPTPPMNLLGDFGGGAMMLAFGMAGALLHVARGGTGQVIDCAITDGAALLNAMTMSFVSTGGWQDERGVNLIDTGAHFYDTYKCADGKYIALGAIEPKFYALLLQALKLGQDAAFSRQLDSECWPELKDRLTALFLRKPRTEWCALLEGTDACFAPVLSVSEAPLHPHNEARQTFVEVEGMVQPAPAPRFSVSSLDHPRAPTHTDELQAALTWS